MTFAVFWPLCFRCFDDMLFMVFLLNGFRPLPLLGRVAYGLFTAESVCLLYVQCQFALINRSGEG